jgi:hypothetical protein
VILGRNKSGPHGQYSTGVVSPQSHGSPVGTGCRDCRCVFAGRRRRTATKHGVAARPHPGGCGRIPARVHGEVWIPLHLRPGLAEVNGRAKARGPVERAAPCEVVIRRHVVAFLLPHRERIAASIDLDIGEHRLAGVAAGVRAPHGRPGERRFDGGRTRRKGHGRNHKQGGNPKGPPHALSTSGSADHFPTRHRFGGRRDKHSPNVRPIMDGRGPH